MTNDPMGIIRAEFSTRAPKNIEKKLDLTEAAAKVIIGHLVLEGVV